MIARCRGEKGQGEERKKIAGEPRWEKLSIRERECMRRSLARFSSLHFLDYLQHDSFD
jgi:hypothetical protein